MLVTPQDMSQIADQCGLHRRRRHGNETLQIGGVRLEVLVPRYRENGTVQSTQADAWIVMLYLTKPARRHPPTSDPDDVCAGTADARQSTPLTTLGIEPEPREHRTG